MISAESSASVRYANGYASDATTACRSFGTIRRWRKV